VAYEVLTELAYKQLQFDTRSPGLHFTCGGMAACAATLTCQPLDMLRTRLASQGEPRVSKLGNEYEKGEYWMYWIDLEEKPHLLVNAENSCLGLNLSFQLLP